MPRRHDPPPVDAVDGAEMIHHPHGRPGPQHELPRRVGPGAVHIQNGGQAVVKIAVVRRHVAVAEGGHRIAPVGQLLHREIFVGHIGPEADENDRGMPLPSPGQRQRHREGKPPPGQHHRQPQLVQRGLARAKALVHRELLRRQLKGRRGQLAIGLPAEKLGDLPMPLPPSGGGGGELDGRQMPRLQHFLEGHSGSSIVLAGRGPARF